MSDFITTKHINKCYSEYDILTVSGFCNKHLDLLIFYGKFVQIPELIINTIILYFVDERWNKNLKHNDFVINNNKINLKSVIQPNYKAVFGRMIISNGIHRWLLKVNNVSIMEGIKFIIVDNSICDAILHQHSNRFYYGYYSESINGKYFGLHSSKYYSFFIPSNKSIGFEGTIKSNDLVEINLNLNKLLLDFTINKRKLNSLNILYNKNSQFRFGIIIYGDKDMCKKCKGTLSSMSIEMLKYQQLTNNDI